MIEHADLYDPEQKQLSPWIWFEDGLPEVRELTEQELYDKLVEFSKRFPHLAKLFSLPIRPPKRGGTYLYCTHTVETEETKLDRLGRKTRYTHLVERPCNRRFRRLKSYRRHFRRTHPEA